MNSDLSSLIKRDEKRKKILKWIYIFLILLIFVSFIVYTNFNKNNFKITVNEEIKYYSDKISLNKVLSDFSIEIDEDDYIILDDEYIDLQSLDKIELSKESIIKVIDVDYKKEILNKTINFKTIETNDPSLIKGETKIKTKGKNGTIEITYNVKYLDGKEVSRTILSEKVIVEKVDEEILIGNKDRNENNINNNDSIENGTDSNSENTEQSIEKQTEECTITINGSEVPCN